MPYQGRGLGTRAVAALTRYAIDETRNDGKLNVNLLIDAMVQQTTVLIAQVVEQKLSLLRIVPSTKRRSAFPGCSGSASKR